MKKFFQFILFLIIIVVMYLYRTPIFNFVYQNFIMNKEVIVEDSNQYVSKQSFSFVKDVDDFSPKNKQDLMNILYTTINRGWKEFTFFCDNDYKRCKKDITTIAGDQELLSNINNYVHPFNSYKSIAIGVDYFGKITVKINPVYTDFEINKINQKVDSIINKIITPGMDNRKKIKVIHDYIIDHTKYDQSKETYQDANGNVFYKNKTNTAYGPLFNGLSLCGGYTDLMGIFLTKINIPNFRISSDNHIWNAVYIDYSWKHLDLTWDDPIVSTGENIITYEFFLISTTQLKKLDQKQHNYEEKIYPEVK